MAALTKLGLAQFLTPACFQKQPELVDELYELFMAGVQPARTYVAQNLACEAHDVCDRLSSISAETLILVGSRDAQTTVGAAKEMAARIPRNQLVILRGLGHGFMWEDPVLYNRAVLDFLLGRDVN